MYICWPTVYNTVYILSREFNVVLEQYVEKEDEFLVNMVRRPRLCYKACFDQTSEDKLKTLHPDGNLLVVLQEVSPYFTIKYYLMTFILCGKFVCHLKNQTENG